jgi:glycosyltransferase involved in cell wall biosynthesis
MADRRHSYGLLMSVYYRDCAQHLAMALSSCDFSQLSEVVVVCDGPVSEEHILTIKKWVPVNLLKLVPLDVNVGLGLALNAGLRECYADYIFRMDADDLSVSDRFTAQINYLAENSCDVLGGQIVEFDNEPHLGEHSRLVPLEKKNIVKFMSKRNGMNHVTVCFNRLKIAEIGAYHDILGHEDYDLWIRAIENGLELANLDKVLVNVRVGNGFIDRRHGFGYLRQEFAFLWKNIGFFRFRALEYIVLRAALRLGPAPLLNYVYSKFVRSRPIGAE